MVVEGEKYIFFERDSLFNEQFAFTPNSTMGTKQSNLSTLVLTKTQTMGLESIL